MRVLLLSLISVFVLALQSSGAWTQGDDLEHRSDQLVPKVEIPSLELPFGATGDGKSTEENPLSFKISLPVSYSYTSNIFQRNFDTDDDTLASFSPTASAQYKFDPTLALGVSINASINRYNKYSSRDLDIFSGDIHLSKGFDNTVIQLLYHRRTIYTPGFDKRLITLDLPHIALQQNNIWTGSHGCIFGGSTCAYSLGATATLRRSTSPDTSSGDNWQASFSPTLIVKDGANKLVYFMGGSITNVEFDNVDRNDLNFGARAGLVWTPMDNVNLSASMSYSGRDSNLDVIDYTGYGLGSSAKLTIKF